MNVKMAETMAQNEQVDEGLILDNISDANLIQLDGAKNELFGNDEPGKFLNGHESKDKNYMVYEYTIKSGGTPESVKYQAVNQGIAKSKNGIQITDANIKEYDKDYKFKAGDKVYVRIPKTELKGTENVPGKTENIDVKGERKVINTEKYMDESIGMEVTKITYDDGSWSTEWGKGRIYEYTEYYPNSNTVKFERFNDGEIWDYTIYDKSGKILYSDGWGGSEALDGADEFDKYDEKGRIIHSEYVSSYDYVYDDKNGTVSCTETLSDKCKIVTVYKQENRDKILSKFFIGETGKKIDLMNGGVEKLIREMGMENVPHIDDY